MQYTADDILLERERRSELIEELLKSYETPLIFVRVNYPGVNKDNALSRNILQSVCKSLSEIFAGRIKSELFATTPEGPTSTLLVSGEPLQIKRETLTLEEEHPLGRCVDIDVYDYKTGYSISRRELGYEPRKCYLCKSDAHICVRSGRHSCEEIIKFIQHTYDEFNQNHMDKNF